MGTETVTTPTADANTVKPATVAEIRKAIPDATADSVCKWAENGYTLQQCERAHMDTLREKVKANAEREAQAKQPKTGNRGVRDVAPAGRRSGASQSTDDGDGDPVAMFDAAVRERMTAGMSRMDAIDSARNSKPELYKDYMLAMNPGRTRTRLLEEKFDLATT